MKKRILALSLVMALALSLGLAAFADDTPNSADPGFDYTWFEVGSATSYGIADGETGKVAWKEIKSTDLTLDGYLDVSKLVKKNGTIFFATEEFAKVKVIKTAASATSLVAEGKATAFEVKAPAAKLTLANKKPTNFTEDTAIFTVPAGTEWAYLNGRDWEKVASGTSIEIPLQDYKQDIWVRTAATATAGPSPVLKLSVPAYTKAPAPKVNLAKGTVSAKVGYEVQLSGGTIVTLEDKQLEVGKTYGGRVLGIGGSFRVSMRVPADKEKGKPPSAWVTIELPEETSPEFIPDEDLALGAKGQILVVGGKPIEMYDATSSKWKKVKKVTKAQLDVEGGVRFRTAGSATKWPSEPYTISLADLY
jgi:hypothetical protein